MNKPYNIQNTNVCNGIFHISFFKALLINEGEFKRHGANGEKGEKTRGERDSGRNDPVPYSFNCTFRFVFNSTKNNQSKRSSYVTVIIRNSTRK
jgi:hypothetical protein